MLDAVSRNRSSILVIDDDFSSGHERRIVV